MIRFARVLIGERPQWVVEVDGVLRSLEGLIRDDGDDFEALVELVQKGTSGVSNAGVALDPARVRWMQPVPRPGKVICLGLNYSAHAAEGGNAPPGYPAFFLRASTSLIAHNAPLIRPLVSSKLDFEAELGVVIGRRARNLKKEAALDAVLGYTCFNDGTIRDFQRRSSQWTIGKNFDGTGALGPWLVPSSELPPGASGLKIQSRLNGEVMQSDNTQNMIVSVASALVLLTEALTLEPGDIVAMGTPSGVGYARTPPIWMKPGDSIEVEIEGVGLIANVVTQE